MTAGTGPLINRNVLVIEDDYLIAQSVAEILRRAGAQVLGPIGWMDEALAFIAANADTFDTVVLDVDLHGEKSYPVAAALATHATKLVFATGYDSQTIEDPYRHCLMCKKPFDANTLIAVIAMA